MMDSQREGSLFVYGSLMFPEVWESVVGGVAKRMEPAKAPGFRALKVAGQVYPGLVPAEETADGSSTTAGLLVFGLDQDDWERLDAFEGAFYERVEIEVVTDSEEDGVRKHRAQVYQVGAEYRSELTDELWEMGEFAKTGLAEFMNRFVR